MLANCRTREDVLNAFRRAGELLKEHSDPLAEARQKVTISVDALPESHVFQLKDDFLRQLRSLFGPPGRHT